jgi:hypothetical protein
MADQMTPSERVGVSDRIAATPAAPAAKIPSHEDHAALNLADHIARGDVGGVRRTVNELEHRLGSLVVDPWVLLREMGELLIRRGDQAPQRDSPGDG